jgi:hypothetical protein
MKIIINKPTEFDAVYLKVDAGVRYWEDARVNGIKDIDLYESKGIGKPLIPCAVQIKNTLTIIYIQIIIVGTLL